MHTRQRRKREEKEKLSRSSKRRVCLDEGDERNFYGGRKTLF